MKYTIETDSHYRSFLKEEGYGYIAQVSFPPPEHIAHLKGMNKGVDMPKEALEAALTNAIEEVGT